MNLDSMKDILDAMEAEGKAFWEIVLETDMENRQVSREESLGKMADVWHAMEDASASYTGERRSMSGLVGGRSEEHTSELQSLIPSAGTSSPRSSARLWPWASATPA